MKLEEFSSSLCFFLIRLRHLPCVTEINCRNVSFGKALQVIEHRVYCYQLWNVLFSSSFLLRFKLLFLAVYGYLKILEGLWQWQSWDLHQTWSSICSQQPPFYEWQILSLLSLGHNGDRLRYDYDEKLMVHFLLASNWKQARAIHCSRIVVESQL